MEVFKMTKEDQDLFYASVGKELTKKRDRMKLTVSQLAQKVGEQYNTIRSIEEGKPFMAHQLTWMKNILDINLNIMISDAINSNGIKEESNGDKEIKREEDISHFI